jgi:hypothetical protein
MADVIGNIVLRTTGGDESAAEVQKATTALNSMTSASSGMESQFQHRFQHIGLMLFAGDALRASGLGAETRQVIGGLNTALIAGESAFGAAAGPAFLFVAALTAVAGIAIKVIEHHKDLAESLDKVVKSQQDALAATRDDIDVITQYNTVVGGASGLLAHEKQLAAIQAGELLDSQKKQVQAIKDLMEANVTHAKVMSLLEDSYENFKQVFTASIKMLLEAIPGVGALVTIYDLLHDKIIKATSALHLHGIEYTINSKNADELTKKNAALQVKLDQLTFSINHQGKAWKDVMKAANENWAEVQKGLDATEKANDKTMDNITKKVFKATDDIAKAFGAAFAQNIVEGKDMGVELEDQFKKMAERFIEYTISMMIVWAALKALMEIWGGPGIAAFKTAALASYPGLAQMGISTAVSGGNQAVGGDMFADKPTMVMFGEAGPEMASFTPLSGGGRSSGQSGQGDIYIGNITTTVSGVNDPDTIARQIGQKIVQQIRGQGQINFARA